jgi:hypothetical protein
MNGIAVYKREAVSRSLSRQPWFVPAHKVHTQPIPLPPAQFTIQRFNDSKVLVQPNTTYYRLIQPNTGHKKSRLCTANPELPTSKQKRATRIKPNQGKSSQIKLLFFIKPAYGDNAMTIEPAKLAETWNITGTRLKYVLL